MKRLPLALLLLAATAACNRSGDSDKPRVAFVTNGIAAFWTIAEQGVNAAEAKLDVDASFHAPKDIVEQKAKLEDLVAAGVDGIAVSPINPADMTSDLDKVAARTKLITHDSDAPDSKRLVYIGMDNYDAGRMVGTLVKQALPEGGKVALFIGRISQDNGRRRRQGVIDELLDRDRDPQRYDAPGSALKGARYAIVDTYLDEFDLLKAKQNCEDALAVHGDLACMVGLFQYNPPLCLEALKQAGKLDKVKVVGFDEHDQTLQGIKDGTVAGTVVQDPYMYGYKSVEVLAALVRGKGSDTSAIPASKFIDIPARVVDRKNVDAFWADLKAKTGQK